MSKCEKKIFVVIGSLEVGGAERHLAYIMPLLRQKGWHVHILCLSPKAALAGCLETNGVPVTILSKELDLRPKLLAKTIRLMQIVYNLGKVYLKNRHITFHYFLPFAYILGTIVGLLCAHRGVKIMSRRSLNLYQQKNKFLKFIEYRLHNFMSLVLGNSKAVVKQLEEEGICPDRIRLIYNGVDVIPAESVDKTQFTMMMVANLIPYKGHKDLLIALGHIKHLLPKGWRIWLVGADSVGILSSLERLTKDLDLDEHVFFKGACDPIPLWSYCHMGILCSHEEGFSNAIIEAAACSVPMVVTNVGGNSDAVIDGETGIVVNANDIPALSAAILRMAQDDDIRGRMASSSYKRFKDNFTVQKCVDAYDLVYHEFICNKER